MSNKICVSLSTEDIEKLKEKAVADDRTLTGYLRHIANARKVTVIREESPIKHSER